MKKKLILYILIALCLIGLLSLFFDKEIIRLISGSRNIVFDYILIGFTFITHSFIIFFFLTTLFLWKENKRRWVLPLWLCFLFSSIISFIIKIIIQRPRPYEDGISVLSILFYFALNSGFSSFDFSFPSFHAMLVFSAYPIINKEFKKISFYWLIFAILVSFSRIYFGVHYLSDIIFGGVIGYFIGYLMILLEEKYYLTERIFKK